MRWIGARPNDEEIVVHHVTAVDAVTLRHELILPNSIVDKERVSIAAHSNSECLARPHGYDVNVQAGRGMKDG